MKWCGSCFKKYPENNFRAVMHRGVLEYKNLCKKCQNKDNQKRRYKKLREGMFQAYGDKCACCGEKEPRFLTIDHSNGDGHLHRKRLNGGRGNTVLRDLNRRGWPQDEGMRVLCMNCNLATAGGKICPHQK